MGKSKARRTEWNVMGEEKGKDRMGHDGQDYRTRPGGM